MKEHRCLITRRRIGDGSKLAQMTMIKSVIIMLSCFLSQNTAVAYSILNHQPLGHTRIQRKILQHFAVKPTGLKATVISEDAHSTKNHNLIFNEQENLEQYKSLQSHHDDTTATFDPLYISSSTTEASTIVSENKETISQQEQDGKEIMFARILLLIAAALYGTNFTFVKVLGEHVPIGASAALRFSLASLATLPWLFGRSAPVVDGALEDSVPGRDEFGVIFSGMEVGMWNAFAYIAQAEGLQTTDASKSAFICSLAVVIVPILDALTGKLMPLNKVMGALMAVFGIGLLELGGFGNPIPTFHTGDILSFVQPIAFGIAFWRMEHAMHKYPNEAPRLTASQLLSVALLSIAYCMSGGLGGVPTPSLNDIISWFTDPSILGSIIWTGIVTTALTIYMETRALKTLSAAETTLIFSTEPLWGAACAALVVGERLGMGAALGALLIVSGCIFSNLEIGNDDENKKMEGDDYVPIPNHVTVDSRQKCATQKDTLRP